MTDWNTWVTAAWNVMFGAHVPYYQAGQGLAYKNAYVADLAGRLSAKRVTKQQAIESMRGAPACLATNRATAVASLLARVEDDYAQLAGQGGGDGFPAQLVAVLKRYWKAFLALGLGAAGGGTALHLARKKKRAA